MNKKMFDDVEYGITQAYENGYFSCTKMCIMAGVKKAIFRDFGENEVRYNLKNYNYVFPDVETIEIESNVTEINITNQMFPNVMHIISYSTEFLNDKDMLISTSGTLKNTFLKNQNYILDMNDVRLLGYGSLNGCLAKEGINTSNIEFIDASAFENYSGKIEKETGAHIFNNILFDYEKDITVCKIPNGIKEIMPKAVNDMKTIMINDTDLDLLDFECKAETLIINSKEDSPYPIKKIHNLKNFLNRYFILLKKIDYNSEYFKSIDGILCIGSNLVYCPKGKTGDIIIPEGIEYIEDNAFENTCISSVVMPKSLKSIGRNAFSLSKNLHKIVFNEGLQVIRKSAFSGCKNLQSLNLPDSIFEIEDKAFKFCPINNLKIPKNLHKINESVFSRVTGNVFLHNSVIKVCYNNFFKANKIYVEDDKIPASLLESLTSTDSFKLFEVHLKNDVLFIPTLQERPEDSKLSKLLSLTNCFPTSVVQKELISLIPAYHSVNPAFKLSFQLYLKTGLNESKKNCNNIFQSFAKQYITFKDSIDDMLDVVKSGVLNKENLEYFLSISQKFNNIPMSAYILEELNKISSETFDI